SFPAILLSVFVACLMSERAVAQGPLEGKNATQASPPPDRAQPPVSPDALPPFTMELEGHITVRDDRTASEVMTKRIKILSQGVVQSLSQQQVQFVEGMQKLE